MSIWLIIYLAVALAILGWTAIEVRCEPLASKAVLLCIGFGAALTWPVLIVALAALLIWWLLRDIWDAAR